jgi:hypothetical protein
MDITAMLGVFATVGTVTGFTSAFAGFLEWVFGGMALALGGDNSQVSDAMTLAVVLTFPQALVIAGVMAVELPKNPAQGPTPIF